MKKRILRFAAGAALVCTSSGWLLPVTGCGGRTLLEESGGVGATGAQGTTGVSSGTTTGSVSSGSFSGAGGSSGVLGSGGSLTGDTGTTGSFTGNTGASGTFSGASGATPYLAPSPPSSAVVLDDMRSFESPTLGYWYTYSDRVIPFSEPVDIRANLPGVINPSEGTAFYPSPNTDPRAPVIVVHNVAEPWPFREVRGEGNDVWGAGFGLDLTDVRPSPTSSVVAAINTCPSAISPLFNPMDPNVLVPTAFNADFKGYKGIGFYAISFTGEPIVVSVQMDDPRTIGWAGTCDVCSNGGRCGVSLDGGADCPCSDSFIESYVLEGTWGLYTFYFNAPNLKTANWSGQNLTPGTILSSTLYNLHFQLSTTGGVPLQPYDFAVAYVFWLTD